MKVQPIAMSQEEFSSNKLAFWEKKNKAKSPPNQNSPNPSSEDSDIHKSDDGYDDGYDDDPQQQPRPPKMQKSRTWKDRFAMGGKKKKKQPAQNEEAQENEATAADGPRQQTAVQGTGFREYEQAMREAGRNTLEESTINEADDIMNTLSEQSPTQETPEEMAAEAEDIVSGFSDASKKSGSSSSGSESGNSSKSSSPKEFAMGLGGSSLSDSEESSDENAQEGILMQAMSDDDGDIELEELFETAAALEVTLETESSVQDVHQELYDNPHQDSQEADSMDVESNSSLSCSTIQEEQTENLEEEQTTVDNEEGSSEGDSAGAPSDKAARKVAAKGTATTTTATATATTLAAVRASDSALAQAALEFCAPRTFQPATKVSSEPVYSKSRTLLYESDEDDHDEEGQASPMPWFAAVPYSTGKWKKTDDGMSVTSDDISCGGSGSPVLPGQHFLPYTVHNSHTAPPPPPKKKPWILIILAILIVLFLVIFLPLWFRRSTSTTRLVTMAPTVAPVGFVGEEPTWAPTYMVTEPTYVPTESDTTASPIASETTAQIVTEFETSKVLVGQAPGDRFGSVVSMTSDGNYMATKSVSPTSPIQAFVRDGSDWTPLPDLPIQDTLVGSGSTVATAVQDGSLIVAVSSAASVVVYQLVDGTTWEEKGNELQWDAPRGISHTSMDLSDDASTLAIGLVDAMGTTISVQVYKFDDYYDYWGYPVEVEMTTSSKDAKTRSVGKNEEGTILSLGLTLSGDGNVLTISKWDMKSSQASIQTFEWEEYYKYKYSHWEALGDAIQFHNGPVSVALSHNGHRLAAVAKHPGKGSVYDWDGSEWKPMGGNAEHGFLPGGSSVAMARDGTRLLIGEAGANKASVYDYQEDSAFYYNAEEWSAWKPTTELWAYDADPSGFGASVAMDAEGSLLGVGAPATGTDNLGQVTMYQRR